MRDSIPKSKNKIRKIKPNLEFLQTVVFYSDNDSPHLQFLKSQEFLRLKDFLEIKGIPNF